MLISVIGTQCIGKSTFIKDFIAKYPNYITPEIDYRKIILDRNLQLNREGNYRSQKILFDFILEQTITCAEDHKQDYILDRSIIDALVYSYWLYNYKENSGFTLENISEMKETVLKCNHLYDALIYIPLSGNEHVNIENDKFRDTNEQYRIDIDNIFKYIIGLIEIHNKAKVISIYGTREERLNRINDYIYNSHVL